MIRRFDAPLSTHVDYRARPLEWMAAAFLVTSLMLLAAGVMA